MELDLARLHAGDEALFTELVELHSPRLVPLLRRYAGAEEQVDDLLQEVWLRAYDKRRQFDGRGSYIGWLLSVARTVGIGSARKRSGDSLLADAPELGGRFDPDEGMLRDTLREAVLALPDRQRDVVILRLVEGFSTAETAQRLGCAEGTVKATLHHATRKLRELLKEMVR